MINRIDKKGERQYFILQFRADFFRDIVIQGVLDHPYTPFLSKTKHFREKRFRQKFYGFEGNIRWFHWFDLEESFEGHVKVTSIFLNGTHYIFLHILVAHLESFPKHYN